MKESTCNHIVMAEGDAVLLTNDDDSYYCQYFNSWDEVNIFISMLRLEAIKAFSGHPDLQILDTSGTLQFPTSLEPSNWGRIDNEGNFGAGK